jgi:hypothetical protein
MKGKRHSPNLYGIAKSILSEGIVVHSWWKKPYDLAELIRNFGKGALQRGVSHAQTQGEEVPQHVLDELAAS